VSFRAAVKRSWAVLVAYAVFSIWGLGCLFTSLALTNVGLFGSASGVGALVGIVVATAVGHVVGNVLGLFGFRLAPIVMLFSALFFASLMSGFLAGAIGAFAMIGLVAMLGGYLGVASRLDVVASWYPLSFAIGGAILWMNTHQAAATFHGGEKHAVWDPFTIVCLAGTVFLMLAFLATRSSLGLTVWQEVGRPAGSSPVTVARPGRGSIVVLLLFTVFVLGATAMVAPYLFRTAEGDQNGEQAKGEDNGTGQKPSKKKKKKKKRKGYGGGGQGGESDGGADDSEDDDEEDDSGVGEAAAEALALALKIFLGILAAALLLLVLWGGVLPPFRRRFLVRHLERPRWPVPPTARVKNLWRRALVPLDVIGIAPEPGETPRDFARRAEAELSLSATGLAEVADIVERVDYAGRGLGSGDEETARRAVERFLAAVEPKLPWRKKLAALWSYTPEVD
jgi:hypothetical protein